MPAMIWKDRKRFLGMPITFTRYSMSEDRLFLKKGLFNLVQEEIL
ncbi:MAG TPA: PH domain-containing protein, partial [Candidatus Gallacutalibacter pullistercoris]|nr:PH domain-containing protein [Candidatus Gallacutalibacter pullistercoris]